MLMVRKKVVKHQKNIFTCIKQMKSKQAQNVNIYSKNLPNSSAQNFRDFFKFKIESKPCHFYLDQNSPLTTFN